MVLKKAAVLGTAVTAMLAAIPSQSQQVYPGASVMLADTVQKAVPKVDKSTAEVVGSVQQTQSVTACGTTATMITLSVNGLLPGGGVPVTGTCSGPLARACKNLRVGSRIRLQGLMAPLPDPTQDGFDVCDPDTWQFFTVLQQFVVLKILK